jgi:tRNA (adenine37-N6)-methyltransferase
MEIKPIGIISSSYKVKKGSPHQGRFSDKTSQIKLFDEYIEGLEGIEKYKHLIVLYWMDRAEKHKLKVIPHGKTDKRGIFSTRAPLRPNPIAMCVVELLELKDNTLTVKWLDALDGSPLIDIKPFWKDMDCF